jgi:hypothetical protein
MAWFNVAEGTLAGPVPQPTGVDIIPTRDQVAVPAAEHPWKAQAGGVEIRTSEKGIFKVTAGKLTRLADGDYHSPVISANGRWAVARSQGEGESGLHRFDLSTGRKLPVKSEDVEYVTPLAFIPSVNRFLVRSGYHGEEDHHEENGGSGIPEEADADSLVLLDPATGGTQAAAGEFRPFAQATFRPLQPTGRLNEFWVAMLGEKGETVVGIYDARLFKFKEVRKLPKIAFNSMRMYVDEPANKVYFVYRGHLLAVPLRKAAVVAP